MTLSPREWHLGIARIKVLWGKRKLVAARESMVEFTTAE